MRVSFPIALSALLLSACTGSTDPSQASLFDNIGNLATGVYAEQEAENAAQIATLEADVAAREREVAAARQAQAANAAAIAELERSIAEGERALAALRANADSPADLDAAARLEGELNRARSAAGDGSMDVEEIRARATGLNRVISATVR